MDKRAGVGLGTAYILGAESDIDSRSSSVKELINTLVNEIKNDWRIEKFVVCLAIFINKSSRK